MNPLARLAGRGRQIDRLVARFTGQGPSVSPAFWLPRARYTVYVRYDPNEAVRAFGIADNRDRRWPDWQRTGQYSVDWSVGDSDVLPRRIPPYVLGLRAADGHLVSLGAGDGSRDHRVDMVFLGAGDWTVEMSADSQWHLTVRPMVGALGGGARAF